MRPPTGTATSRAKPAGRCVGEVVATTRAVAGAEADDAAAAGEADADADSDDDSDDGAKAGDAGDGADAADTGDDIGDDTGAAEGCDDVQPPTAIKQANAGAVARMTRGRQRIVMAVTFHPDDERRVGGRPRRRRVAKGREVAMRPRGRRSGLTTTALGVALAVAVALTGCGAGPPGPPSAYIGTVVDRPVPSSIDNLPLTADDGNPTSLAALRGQVVVLADFMTLCQETCPLTTGNLLTMDRAVTAAGLGTRVRFVELTVDPARDSPAALAAYRKVVAAPANMSLLTGSEPTIDRIWQHFGIWFQKVAEPDPPGIDWRTGKPLTYDVNHEDALIYLDATGRQRFTVVGSPNARSSAIAPTLRGFLDAQGRTNLASPDASTWTPAQGLAPIAWLTRHRIKGSAG